MNATTKDLARIAALAARQPAGRSSKVDMQMAGRTSTHSVRFIVHVTTTILLGLAVVVLAVKLSEERALRRQTEAQVRENAVAHRPNVGAEQQPAAWAFQAALVARMGMAGNSTTNAAALTTTAATASATRDRDVQQQLRHQLSDPTLRGALRGQQRSAVLQMYGDLLRSWHLSADKSDRMVDLLAEQQLRELDRSLAASDTSGQGMTIQPGGAQPGVQSDASDDLKALLTDAQRAQLSQRQATLSERLTVSSLSDELSLAQMPMTDSQQQQLIQIMYDERTAIPAPTVDNSSANSPDAQRALDDWQSALDQRVQDRAETVLTSAQEARYEQFLSRQREARNAFASFDVAQSGDNANAGEVAPPSATVPPQGP